MFKDVYSQNLFLLCFKLIAFVDMLKAEYVIYYYFIIVNFLIILWKTFVLDVFCYIMFVVTYFASCFSYIMTQKT